MDSQIEGLIQLKTELQKAFEKFPSFASPHEGIAIIEEEFLELRNEVFWGYKIAKAESYEAAMNKLSITPEQIWHRKMEKEAVQLAAMALRLVIDITSKHSLAPVEPEIIEG